MNNFNILDKLVDVLPKLRNQFSFVGFVVMIGAFVAVRKVAPDALPAQITAGSIGVTIIIFGQVFYYLRLIREGQRAWFILAMFAVFCGFMISLTTITAHQIINPATKIFQVSLHGIFKGELVPANTLDDLVIRWSHEGEDNQFEILLRAVTSGLSSEAIKVLASDHLLRIPASRLKRLWPYPKLDEVYSIRVEFQGEDTILPFGLFDVKTALRIIYFLDSNEVTVASLVDERNLISHTYDAKVVAWPMGISGPKAEPEAVDVHAPAGKGKARFPDGFVPDPTTLKCVYLGRYPTQLVRYKNLHTD